MAAMAKSVQIADFDGRDATLLAESGILVLGSLDAVTGELGDEEIAITHDEAAPVTPPLPPA